MQPSTTSSFDFKLATAGASTLSFAIKMKLFITLLACSALLARGEDTKLLNANEVGSKFILVGNTGVQLGKQVEVIGKVVLLHAYTGIQIHVERIEDKPAGPNIYLSIADQQLKESDVGKRIRVIGQEIGQLRPIPLINQIDRTPIGNMGIELSFMITKHLDLGDVSGDSTIGTQSEQAGTGQPATRSQSKSEGIDKPQPEAKGHSR